MNTAVIGLQWGDEGKEKIVDILAESHDWIVRYNGGANAGHTVYVDNKKHVFNLLPSGVLHPEKICVLGNGMVVDPVAFAAELCSLPEKHAQILLSDRAHVVFPAHKQADADKEKSQNIGTTKKGIGPAYADKISRQGIRFCDDAWEKFFSDDVVNVVKSHVTDTRIFLNTALIFNNPILFEGAQATLLDIDHGTYPYVTSSSASIGGIYTGTGIRPKELHVIGVAKAYTTRVGEGPFPTELNNELGEYLRQKGSEFGATTGRPRRCGWFDAVVAKYSAEVNNCDEIVLTKLDVLSDLERVAVCTHYEKFINNQVIDEITIFPSSVSKLKEYVPHYEFMQGWNGDISNVKNFNDLPVAARDYVKFIEDSLEVKVGFVGVGSDRNQIIRKLP